MREEFNCKGKHLALYLMKHGSKLIRIERVDGFIVYVFDNDESSKWIYKMEVYYNLTKDQYDYMVVNGLIDNDTKELYIVNDDVNPLGDIYEETISADNASNIWTIHHKLATEWYKLNITLLDSDNNIIYGDIDLDNTTINQIVFRFSEPVSGIVYIKK